MAISINILSLSSIDTQDQSFKCDASPDSLDQREQASKQFMSQVYTFAASPYAQRQRVACTGVHFLCVVVSTRRLQGKPDVPITADNWEPRIRFLNLSDCDDWKMKVKTTDNGEIGFKYMIAGTFKEVL